MPVVPTPASRVRRRPGCRRPRTAAGAGGTSESGSPDPREPGTTRLVERRFTHGRQAARFALAATLFLLLLPAPARALDPARRLADYARDAWTMTDGLPQESITAILQTRDGYLWLGTLDGLVRFDGVRFETFNLIRRVGMESNVVLGLAEGPPNTVWVATRAGVCRYADSRFSVPGDLAGLANDLVRSVAVDASGALWIGTRANGLHRLQNGALTRWTSRDGLAGDDVRTVAVDGDGTIWAGAIGGLSRVRDGRAERIAFGETPEQRMVLSLVVRRSGAVWAGTSDGIWAVAPDGRVISAGARPLTGFQVRTLAEDVEGSVWAGLSTGLARVRAGAVEMTAGRELLTHGDIRSLETDREGSLWIGTDGGGLNRFRDASVVMVRSGVNPDSDTLMAVTEDAAGTVWTAANCGGVIRWPGGVPAAITTKDGLPDDCTRSLAASPDGSIWVGSVGGLAQIAGRRITRFTTADGLSSNRVMAIAIDRDGSVWVGTTDGGLDRLAGGRFTNLSTGNGLSYDDVRALLVSRDGGLWVGTLGGGLNHVKGGIVRTFTRHDGLSNNNVLALLEDPDGTLWIGTNGGGLNRLRDGVFTHYTTGDGLFSDGIFQILDDGLGHLWMGCNRGVFRVSREDLDAFAEGRRRAIVSTSFGAADGLQPGGVMGGAQPAGWRDRSGRLWFPTIAGAAVIDPGRLVKNAVVPPVHVERVVVDRQEWPIGAPLVFPAGSQEVEFHFTAPSFVAPEKVRFRYWLEGFNRDWVDSGSRRAAYFANLSPRAYRFKVTAANNDGVWNELGAEVAFEVEPRFHQTPLFAILAVVLTAGLGWGAYRLRVRQLRVREHALARQVEEALAEIKVLRGLLPICASCKRIRDDRGEWSQVEAYIRQHSQAEFSHGLCPECATRLYGEPEP